ncbi:hypothetical protein HPB50_023190 [Hyalomma asiaticum]|uniref:Uncharacterized protein n=1 Tax=Hyalomma asiaticum TaxID=266040 RepID=A0ACB7TQ14_HYAAI|nr:hypothetical protein HPB50_023190 [Hyalomma asiaticum]
MSPVYHRARRDPRARKLAKQYGTDPDTLYTDAARCGTHGAHTLIGPIRLVHRLYRGSIVGHLVGAVDSTLGRPSRRHFFQPWAAWRPPKFAAVISPSFACQTATLAVTAAGKTRVSVKVGMRMSLTEFGINQSA